MAQERNIKFTMQALMEGRAAANQHGSLAMLAVGLESSVTTYLALLERSVMLDAERAEALTTLHAFLQAVTNNIGQKAKTAHVKAHVETLRHNFRYTPLGDKIDESWLNGAGSEGATVHESGKVEATLGALGGGNPGGGLQGGVQGGSK